MIFWILLFSLVGAYGYYLSRLQPFPEIGGRFAATVLLMAFLLWISSTSPREGSEHFPAFLAVFVGGASVVVGARSMGVTKTDVIVAPLGGILFCLSLIHISEPTRPY